MTRSLSKRIFLPSPRNRISELAESFADDILEAVAKEVPLPPRCTHTIRGVRDSAAFNITWDARVDARRFMRIEDDKTARKTLRTACAKLQGVIDAGLYAYFEEYLAETERLLADNDQRGFYNKHMKGTVGLDGRNARSDNLIVEEDGTLLRDNVRILQR